MSANQVGRDAERRREPLSTYFPRAYFVERAGVAATGVDLQSLAPFVEGFLKRNRNAARCALGFRPCSIRKLRSRPLHD